MVQLRTHIGEAVALRGEYDTDVEWRWAKDLLWLGVIGFILFAWTGRVFFNCRPICRRVFWAHPNMCLEKVLGTINVHQLNL